MGRIDKKKGKDESVHCVDRIEEESQDTVSQDYMESSSERERTEDQVKRNA